MSDDAFSDLRLNRQEGQVQEGFWPSFTDIMTVVVMIFMVAMVTLLIRNMELVDQLRATMEAERIAAELARATGEEKDHISAALTDAEEQVQRMQLELLRLQDKGLRQEALIAEQLRRITGLTSERDDLTQQAAQLVLLRQRLEAEVENRKAEIAEARRTIESRNTELQNYRTNISSLESSVAGLQSDLAALRMQLAGSQAEVASSRERISTLQTQAIQRQQDLDRAQDAARDVERKYLVLAGQHDDLQVKYNKLVRPARSSSGRHLIEVRYWKAEGKYRISWREGNEDPYQDITRKQLDLVLKRLDRDKGNGLYIKVIFPENSGLSYNEAWSFTSHLHKNYDYYFKEDTTE